MAISQKLMMRQGQSLVMTPQLLQAIKLLQFSSAELTAFLQEEMERNPLLESEGPGDAVEPVAAERAREESSGESVGERVEGDWAKESLSTDAGEYAANLGADVSNLYDSEEPARSRSEAASPEDAAGLSAPPGRARSAVAASRMARRRISRPMSHRRRICARRSRSSSRWPARTRVNV
jgi:RNA polymerase sigma-54 factor